MTKYTKSPIDELFYSLMGFYPTKEGAAYEIISAAALSLFEQRETKHNQFLNVQFLSFLLPTVQFGCLSN